MHSLEGIHYLYRHTRLDKDEPFYIGIGTKRRDREAKTNKTEYQRAYAKSGRNNVWKNITVKTDYEVEILLESDNYEFIKQKETEFITLYGRINKKSGILANLTDGGEGVKGMTVSESTKKLQVLNNNFRRIEKEKYIEKRTGEIFITNQGYTVVITKYNNSKDCSILIDGKIEVDNISYCRIKKINNPFHKVLSGIGYFGVGEYKNTNQKSYHIWNNMISRSLENNSIICEEWHNFQNFAQWYENNWKYWMKGWRIDKDILVKGNKIYSPETCCLTPSEFTNIFKTEESKIERLSTGVRKGKSGKYTAVTRIDGVTVRFSGYSTNEEAYEKYKQVKEKQFKDKAIKYRGQITEECFNAIYNYKITE